MNKWSIDDQYRELGCNLFLAILYGSFFLKNVSFLMEQIKVSVILVMIVNFMVFALAILRRSPQRVSLSFIDIVFTMMGTFSTLFLVGVQGPEYLSLEIIGSLGVIFSIYGIFHLRRSFGLLPAHRGLVTSGPYQWVRHPIYAGYFINNTCFIIQNYCLYNLIFYLGFVVGETIRLLREEKILASDPEYCDYMKRTRWRILPHVF